MLNRSLAQATVIVTGRHGKHHHKAVHNYKSCQLS